MLNAQGRIQGDLTVWRQSDDLELEVTADQIDKLLVHLDHFIIMDDVDLVSVEGETAIGLTGRSAARLNARGGMLVVAVRPDSPAAASGLHAGDVIETVNGAPADSLELRRLLAAFDATPATLGVVRDGHSMTLRFSLAGDNFQQR